MKRSLRKCPFELLAVLLLATAALATNVSQFVSAQGLTVNQTTPTTIRNNLTNATTVQMYVKTSGTPQIFTLTLPNGTTIEVPSGGVLTLRFASNLAANDTIGSVLTATGSTVFQVISIREVKQ